MTHFRPVVGTLLALLAAVSPLSALAQSNVSVLTYHNDGFRTGQNSNEVLLTPSNVNVSKFGRLFTRSVDGNIHAQPLYVPNVSIPGKGVHNVVYVATTHGTVYAFDADDNTGSNYLPLWQDTFVNPTAGVFPLLYTDYDTADYPAEVAILGTPVIDGPGNLRDPAANTLYVVVATRETSNGTTSFVFRLHALDIRTGAERLGSPAVIQAAVPGTGDDSVGGIVPFVPLHAIQRPGLLLLNGVVYICIGSVGDVRPCHGWIFGYDAVTLQQVAVFNTAPNSTLNGIWMSGGAPATDNQGNFYVMTGNGDFNPGQGSYGDSFLKFRLLNGLNVVDYFAPYNQADLEARDYDLGVSAPLLLPDEAGSILHPHLMVGCGKEGKLYVLDRDNLGKWNAGADSQIPQSVPDATGYTHLHGPPVYWHGPNGKFIYLWGEGAAYLRQFQVDSALVTTTPVAQGSFVGGGGQEDARGGFLSVSSNGTYNGVVWANMEIPRTFRAYDATNVANELYHMEQNSSRDYNPYGVAHFCVPTIANGKVFVGGVNYLSVYGLLGGRVLAPLADSCVAAGNRSTLNYGSYPWIVINSLSDPTSVFNYAAYFKFDLTGLTTPPASATLTLTLNGTVNPAKAPATLGVYAVANTSWTESGLTGSNAPGLNLSAFSSTGTLLDTQQVTLVQGNKLVFNVGPYVAAHLGQQITLQVMETLPQDHYFQVDSKEGTNPPRLTLVYPAPSDISSKVSCTVSKFVYNAQTQTFDATLTVTNLTGTALTGPLQAYFSSLGTNLLCNNSGIYQSHPYLTVSSSGLGAGASVNVPLHLRSVSASGNYTPHLLCGDIY